MAPVDEAVAPFIKKLIRNTKYGKTALKRLRTESRGAENIANTERRRTAQTERAQKAKGVIMTIGSGSRTKVVNKAIDKSAKTAADKIPDEKTNKML